MASKIEGMYSLKLKLKDLRDKAARASKRVVWVGYQAEYAVFVHENLQAFHPVGQAKFLEQPARDLKGVMAQVARQAMQRGATLDEALYAAGLLLERESQLLCPVDTGFLRNSAFTLVEIL